jgi:hypothetical protein
MSTPRPAMLVATVTRPFLPASRDYLAFALVVFGVEYLVRDALALFKKAESSSFFSIETVPTKTGWPFWCSSLTARASALNLPSRSGR